MYNHGGIHFPRLRDNRVHFQVDFVGPNQDKVWSWGHILSKPLANRVNFQVDSVELIGAEVWSWGHILS